jgi:hypothetical protein
MMAQNGYDVGNPVADDSVTLGAEELIGADSWATDAVFE